VITTRNDNPSVAEYDDVVLPEWRKCEEIRAAVKQEMAGVPSLEQMRAVYKSVLTMLAVKMVPATEVAERLDEAFARCRNGAYPVDRMAVEAGIRDGVDAELTGRGAG
jgi:hypothetical protein